MQRLTAEQLAYAVWPWGVNEKEQMRAALKDVRDAGFDKFESIATAVSLFKDNLAEFKAITDEFGVYPVSFYFWQTGDYAKDTGIVEESLGFLAANNVRRMSLQAPGKPNGGATEDELQSVLKVINRIGELAKPYGIVPCVHPHANTMIMYESDIDFIMQNTDPEYISMGPDTAHLTVGKCDPVEIFARYIDRIAFTHIKDVKRMGGSVDQSQNEGFEIFSDFLELGQGDVDLPGVFDVLATGGYKGYLTIELDQSKTTNKVSAIANMAYMRRAIGV